MMATYTQSCNGAHWSTRCPKCTAKWRVAYLQWVITFYVSRGEDAVQSRHQLDLRERVLALLRRHGAAAYVSGACGFARTFRGGRVARIRVWRTVQKCVHRPLVRHEHAVFSIGRQSFLSASRIAE